jgi:hypothetical protein
VREAWDRAWDRGYRRIGMMLFDMPDEMDVHERHAAFWERQRSRPQAATLPILSVRPAPDSVAAVAEWRRQTLRQLGAWVVRSRPDVVLGFNDSFFWLLHDAGFRVPGDFAFVDLWISRPSPDRTGLRLLQTEVSARAVDWLNQLLHMRQRGAALHPRTIRIALEWQDGQDLPPRPQALPPVRKAARPRAGTGAPPPPRTRGKGAGGAGSPPGHQGQTTGPKTFTAAPRASPGG